MKVYYVHTHHTYLVKDDRGHTYFGVDPETGRVSYAGGPLWLCDWPDLFEYHAPTPHQKQMRLKGTLPAPTKENQIA